jgi:hypothetical protein
VSKVLEDAIGRLLSGALWGLGAGLVLAATRGGGQGLRPLAKSAVKTYLAASERVREITGEARESLEDLYTEARAEHHEEEAPPPPVEEPAARPRRRQRA